ncbi:kelch-like protein 32 [Branchiostoma floridae x Branchiostoma belcheri]
MTTTGSLTMGGTDEDVILIAEGRKFPANKASLIASSDYFKAMFSSGMRETSQEEVNIHGVTSSGLDKALQFITKTKLDLTLDTIREILSTASYLQMTALLQHCTCHLKSIVDINNCLTVYDIGQEFHLDDVCICVEPVLKQSFTNILGSDVLVDIPFKLLLSILSSDELLVAEKDVFNAACNWLYHDREGRMHQSDDILQAVRFPLMTASMLDRIRRSPVSRDYPNCVALLTEASDYHADVNGQPLRQSPQTVPRGATSHVLVAGGLTWELSHDAYSNILCYNIEAKNTSSWEVLTNMPGDIARSGHSVAVVGNFLFLAGGLGGQSLEILNTAHRYDPRTNHWLELSNMEQSRMQFCLIPLGNSIYAVGGLNMQWRLDSVERFDIQKNSWSNCSRLPQPCSGHASAVCSGRLYVCGGVSSAGGVHDLGAFLSQMVCYDPEEYSWTLKSPMAIGRAFHAMATVNGAIYIAGGGNALLRGTLLDVSAIEKYDPATDQWSMVNSMATPRCYMGVATTPTEIFLLGGQSTWEGLSQTVDRYRPQENQLGEAEDMRLPEPVYEAECCVLVLSLINRTRVKFGKTQRL